MFKLLRFISIIFLTALFFNNNLLCQIGVGFTAGLSTPNNNVNDIYNKSRLQGEGVIANLYRDGTKLGYNIGMGVRVPLSDNFLFRAGINWHKFPETGIKVDTSNALYKNITSSQNIIPIGAGFNYYIINSYIGIYLVGELTYNYMSASVDWKGVAPISGVSASPTDSRVGFGAGFGIDLKMPLVTLNLEPKYNLANLIGKTTDEQSKNYITLNLAVFFGDSNPK